MSGSWLSSIYKLWCPVCFVMTHLRWNFPKTSFRLLPCCCCFFFFSLPSLNISVSYMHQRSNFSWIHRGCVSPLVQSPLSYLTAWLPKNLQMHLWIAAHGFDSCRNVNGAQLRHLGVVLSSKWKGGGRGGGEEEGGGILAVVVRSAFRVCASLNWGHAQKRGGGGEGGPL